MLSAKAIPGIPMLDTLTRTIRLDGLVKWLDTAPETDRTGDVLLVLALAAFALVAMTVGYDAALLISGDSLFPVQFWEHSPLAYRPPPSTNLFPDLLLHGLAGLVIADPLEQKLAVGVLLFILSGLLVGFCHSRRTFALFLAILATAGFGSVDTTAHFTIPMMIVTYHLARPGWPRWLVLFVIVFSDLLVLLPLTLTVLLHEDRKTPPASVLVAIAAAGLNVLYSEFSEAFLNFAIIFPPFVIACLIAKRFGLLATMGLCLCVALPLLSLVTPVPARYTAPIAAAMLMALNVAQFRPLDVRSDWRVVFVPIICMGLFLASVDFTRSDNQQAAYTCLAETLSTRGIEHVAVDHWASKPLAMTVSRKGIGPSVTQMDFGDNQTEIWMAPYAVAGSAALHAVRDTEMCAFIGNDPRFCGHEWAAPVVTSERMCGQFDLFTYETAVPANLLPPPDGKLSGAIRHGRGYITKFQERIAGFIGQEP